MLPASFSTSLTSGPNGWSYWKRHFPAWPPLRSQLEAVRSAAEQRNLKVRTLEVRTSSVAEWENAFSSARGHADALLVLSSPLFGTRPNFLAELSVRYRLP